MNTSIMMEMDPLSYEAQFESFAAPSTFYPQANIQNIQSNVQTTEPNIPIISKQNDNQINIQTYSNSYANYDYIPPHPSSDVKPNVPEANQNVKPSKVDGKPDLTKKKKEKGKTSNYWNKKIADKDFAFYGCSICNIAYTELHELDQHVTIHSNRITSYDLRMQNLKKRKRLKKIKKKAKKHKVKQEWDVDIKPEDGYIGTEKANEFQMEEDTKHNVKNSLEDNENSPENDKNADNQNNVNVYKCFGCDKQFALSYYLKIHVRSHTDEKPYLCSECGQSFITASKRGRHVKRIHQSVRHQCRICYKFFSRFELLVKHFDKNHAEDKIEGEPYDYNTILPYIKELEEQLKLEKEKKPKTENVWDQSTDISLPVDNRNVPIGNTDLPTGNGNSPAGNKSESHLKHIKDEISIECHPLVNEIFVDAKCEMVTSEPIQEVNLDEVKEEMDDGNEHLNDHHDANDYDDGNDDVMKKNEWASDDEYFPSQTWVGPPPAPVAPAAPDCPRGEGGKVRCDVCNKNISSRSYLVIHMRTHTGEKPFTCYICKRGFITASKMHRHVLTHVESWEGIDGVKPEDVKSAAESGDDDAERKNKKKSKLEKAKAKLMQKSKDSVKKKRKKRPYTCEYCHQRFLHMETLQVHRKSEHEGEALVLQCRYCLEIMPDEDFLKQHEPTHTGAKPYLCTLCGKSYKKRETFIYHRKNHESSEDKAYVCDICSKRFKSHAVLQRHIIAHSVPKFSLQYECPVCAHMFHTRYHVQMHLNTHMKEGLILEENRSAVLAMVLQNARKIPKCNDVTTPPQNAIRTDERSRICNICGQIFQHFYYLEDHLKTHGTKIAVEDLDKEEVKKYTCQVCSKSFKLHYYLKLHSFTHTKEKPFICQQCGKGFITKGKLKRHLETHQGLKKYQCHICCKFFTRPSYLRIHVRTIHGTQDYNFRDFSAGVAVGNR